MRRVWASKDYNFKVGQILGGFPATQSFGLLEY